MSDDIAEAMTDNVALREILGQVRLLEDHLKGQYDDIVAVEGEAVTSATPYTRAATPTAVKTAVTNTGGADVLIYEGDGLVRRLASHETWVSPLNGAGELNIYAVSTDSEVAVTTWTKE